MSARPSLRDIRILLATWFGSGYAPKAPGTVGSITALPFAWLIAEYSGFTGLIIATVVVTMVGIWAANAYMAVAGEKDPGPVVIDEVAGMWLTLLPISATLSWQGVLLAFILFRLFDILKPWPISWVDISVPGGLGVMLDDILAGIAAAACLYGFMRMFPDWLG